MMDQWARIFFMTGLLLIGAGCVVALAAKIPWLGRLPGDILLKKDNVTFYAPVMTSVILSLLVSLILWLFRRP